MTRVLAIILALAVSAVAADQSWKQHVADRDRDRQNPYPGRADAIAAGAHLFVDLCAQCHGRDARGRGKHPSLRTAEVQAATDGEIFWILKNGFLARGMPSWSSLPEASRWQPVAYIRTLGLSSSERASPGARQKIGR